MKKATKFGRFCLDTQSWFRSRPDLCYRLMQQILELHAKGFPSHRIYVLLAT